MKALTLFAPNPSDATSFYRAIGPFQALKRTAKTPFILNQITDVNWASLKSSDALFMQRPFTKSHGKIFDMAKSNGKKVWIDYDDDLFSVPMSNKTFRTYGQDEVHNLIANMVVKADVVSVSTSELKKSLGSMMWHIGKKKSDDPECNFDQNKIIVVPNAYDENLFKHYRKGPMKKNQNKLFTWRGSDTHDKDLMCFTPEIKSAFSKHLDWTLNMVGSPFWYTIECLDNIEGLKPNNVLITEAMDPIEFFKFLWLTAPALMVVPLWDCQFNRAKSNIAWIEGCHAGAVTLAPDWPEWKRPGIINYTDNADFEKKLDSFIRGEFDGKKLYAESWQYIQENLTLDVVNRNTREKILEKIFEEKEIT